MLRSTTARSGTRSLSTDTRRKFRCGDIRSLGSQDAAGDRWVLLRCRAGMRRHLRELSFARIPRPPPLSRQRGRPRADRRVALPAHRRSAGRRRRASRRVEAHRRRQAQGPDVKTSRRLGGRRRPLGRQRSVRVSPWWSRWRGGVARSAASSRPQRSAPRRWAARRRRSAPTRSRGLVGTRRGSAGRWEPPYYRTPPGRAPLRWRPTAAARLP
jgi:hypothetical protein